VHYVERIEMPTIIVTVSGKPRDHQLKSPRLSQEDAEAQLAQISEAIGEHHGTLSLPWCAIKKSELVAAQLRPDSSMPAIA
jgi:hypothetical protein